MEIDFKTKQFAFIFIIFQFGQLTNSLIPIVKTPQIKICAGNQNNVHETTLKIPANLSSNHVPFNIKLSYSSEPLKCGSTNQWGAITTVNISFYLPTQITFFQNVHKAKKKKKFTANFPAAWSNEEPIKFLSSGKLNHTANLWSTFYETEDYCLHRLNTTHMQAQICMSTCDPGHPNYNQTRSSGDSICIPKCCPPDTVVDLGSTSGQCQDSGEIKWKPSFFDSRTLDNICISQSQKTSHPIYHIQNRGCREINFFPATSLFIDDLELTRGNFRLLEDGRLVRRNLERNPIQRYPRWLEVKEKYCIDGMQNFQGNPSVFQPYTGNILHGVIFLCEDDEKGGESEITAGAGESKFNNQTTSYLQNIGMNFSGYKMDEMQIVLHEFQQQQQPGIKSIVYISIFYFSLIPLFLTMIAYWITWNIQNIHGWTIFCHLASQFFTNLFLGTAHLFSQTKLANQSPTVSCKAIGILAHFFFLSTFFWLTVVNFDVWLTFRKLTSSLHRSRGFKRFLSYSLFAWGGPAVIISIGLILNSKYGIYGIDSDCDIILPNYGLNRCYIHHQAEGVYLYYIIGILILCNFVFFILTVYVFYKYRSSTKPALQGKSGPDNSQGELFTKLFIVMGVSFSFEYISWCFEAEYPSTESIHWAWIVIDCINWLARSILIFIIFACKRKTFVELKKLVS